MTSSPEFALQSYEVKAEDYILKPVTAVRLNAVLDECARRNESEPESIVLRTHFGYQKVYFKDIEYVEAQNKKALFYIKNGDIMNRLIRFFRSALLLRIVTAFLNVTETI